MADVIITDAFKKECAAKFGIRAQHALAVVADPDQTFVLEQNGLTLRIHSKYIEATPPPCFLIVIEQVKENTSSISFALRVYPDLCEGFSQLHPNDMLEAIAERFGVPIRVGESIGKFIWDARIPIANEGDIEIVYAQTPQRGSFVQQMYIKINQGPPMEAECALAYCLNTEEYVTWLNHHSMIHRKETKPLFYDNPIPSEERPKLDKILTIINDIKNGVAANLSDKELYNILWDLTGSHPLLPYTWENDGKEKNAFFHRGRRVRDLPLKPTNIKQLSYPPDAKQLKNYGRCNKPYTPMLYASATVSTIFLEFNAKVKDEFYIIRIRPQKGSILTGFVIGDLNYYRNSEQSYFGREKEHEIKEKIINQNNNEDLARIYFVDAFLAEMFMHPTEENYKITASLTDLFLRNNNRIQTLAYPSVRFTGKTNFVMSPSNYDEIMECYESLIANDSWIRPTLCYC